LTRFFTRTGIHFARKRYSSKRSALERQENRVLTRRVLNRPDEICLRLAREELIAGVAPRFRDGSFGFELVQKPYSVEQLARVLHKIGRWRKVKRTPASS
jgi:hypothetical protein